MRDQHAHFGRRLRFTPTPVGNALEGGRLHPAYPVHPHACGECSVSFTPISTSCGSPPRLWGMRAPQRVAGVADRFTPTPVGNAFSNDLAREMATVHPHACGECHLSCRDGSCACGSPPRLWGMPSGVFFQERQQRFTPTPVGNARLWCCRCGWMAVHPHACGECAMSADDQAGDDGSPPRLWGMQRRRRLVCQLPRFTPTPVGNASAPARSAGICAVHPHACGECLVDHVADRIRRGSPPRLWGMLHPCPCRDRRRRFTPTPVGNARHVDAQRRRAAVHPHACGECVLQSLQDDLCSGSPPRLWGMRAVVSAAFARWRFTPTPVGNAPTPPCTCVKLSVHPHACGECAQKYAPMRRSTGSPPRLWGMQRL